MQQRLVTHDGVRMFLAYSQYRLKHAQRSRRISSASGRLYDSGCRTERGWSI